MSLIVDGTTGVTFNDSSLQGAAASPYVLKNRIINGDMRIDQRNAGASHSIPAGNTYTMDRWFIGVGTAAITGQRVAGSGGYQYAYRLTGGAGNTGVFLSQRIESFNTADLVNTVVTVQIQLSASAITSIGWDAYAAGSTDNYGSTTSIAGGTITGISSTPNKFTFSFNAGANAANGIQLTFTIGAMTSGTITISGVQLEIGTSATPFERRLFNQELTNCQRYYIQSYPYGTVAGTNIGASGAGCLEGVNYGQTAFGYTLMGPLCFPVTMRTNPTVTVYNPITGSSAAATCIRNVNASTDVAGYVLSASDKSVYVSCNGVGVTIRAECAITATAEL